MLKTAVSKAVKLLHQTETSVCSFIHLREEQGLRITLKRWLDQCQVRRGRQKQQLESHEEEA